MRIGFIIYGNLDTLTGGYLYDKMVVEGLTELGHEVELLSLAPGSYLKRLAQGCSKSLYHRLLTGRFDIVIADELCHPSLIFVQKRLCSNAERPLLVALVHHILCDEPRPRWRNMVLGLVERNFLNSVDGFIHNSATTRRMVESMVERDRPEVIAYPAGDRFASLPSTEEISRRTHLPGPLKLLFLGIVIPRKGLLPLLSALADIDRDTWSLSIVGGLDFDPAYTSLTERHTRQLGLSDSVRFLGPLYDDDLVEILNTSHLFCMPYAYEGFGIAMLEAMAFGLPAIGSRTGAASETISHGTNGFLLDFNDREGLKPLLLQLHEDRGRLQEMALAAHATYNSRSSWQDCISAIETFLQTLNNCQARDNSAPQRAHQ